MDQWLLICEDGDIISRCFANSMCEAVKIFRARGYQSGHGVERDTSRD